MLIRLVLSVIRLGASGELRQDCEKGPCLQDLCQIAIGHHILRITHCLYMFVLPHVL